MSWIYLLLAGMLEIAGVVGVKKVSEKASWTGYFMLIGGFIISLSLLQLALEEIPLSIAYAIWTGIGTLGATIIGIFYHNEAKNSMRLFCIFGIIVTIIGLRLVQ